MYYPLDSTQQRSRLRRKLRGVDDVTFEAWMSVEPLNWTLRHAPALHEAGLTPEDAADLYRRLGEQTAQMLSSLIDAGRMADIDTRYIHLWAASGLLRPEITGTGRAQKVKFTRWVTEARKYIMVCRGDQHLSAAAAAAGLSVDETRTMRTNEQLDIESLELMAALRESPGAVDD